MRGRDIGQLAIIARDEIALEVAEALLDDIVVVQQPFGGRADQFRMADRCDDTVVVGEYGGPVLA